MKKNTIMAGLGHFYTDFPTGLAPLPFVYNNIKLLATSLSSSAWNNTTPLLDVDASVSNIKAKMMEMISNCKTDDWLLFYFTGHCSKYYSTPDANPLTYAVTYVENLSKGQYPSIENFLSADDYDDILSAFQKQAPNGHLITILDCCYAFGLMDNFLTSTDYHTIIAAASGSAPALYDDNSVFFKEFQKVLQQPFNKMQKMINDSFNLQQIPEQCIVQPAKNFQSLTL